MSRQKERDAQAGQDLVEEITRRVDTFNPRLVNTYIFFEAVVRRRWMMVGWRLVVVRDLTLIMRPVGLTREDSRHYHTVVTRHIEDLKKDQKFQRLFSDYSLAVELVIDSLQERNEKPDEKREEKSAHAQSDETAGDTTTNIHASRIDDTVRIRRTIGDRADHP